jgi:hypothetical protein
MGLLGLATGVLYGYGIIAQLEDDGRVWPNGVAICIAAFATVFLAWFSYNEHTRSRPFHDARSNTAWYAMLIPAAGALIFAASVEYPLPYPGPDQAVTAEISRIALNAPREDELDLEFALKNHPLTYTYECRRERKYGWCALHDQLVLLGASPRPRIATIVAVGHTLLMAHFDKVTLIDWEHEHESRRNAALILAVAAIACAFFGLSGAIMHGIWAIRLAREQVR